jgi:hypothetical protein
MRQPWQRILLAAIVVAALDITEVIVFYGWRGVPPTRILQSVAAGLLGRSAYEGGRNTALLGLALHSFMPLSSCVCTFSSAAN